MMSTIDLSGRTILQVIPELETGGAERTTLEVGRAIIASGGRSIVLSQGGRLVDQLVREGSVHVVAPVASKNPLTLWANSGLIRRLIAAECVNLVHARSRAPAWSSFWAARASAVPFVTTYHGIYNAKSKVKQLYNSVMARGDTVIANSAYTASTVTDAYGASPFFDCGRLVVIPRGADLGRFTPKGLTETSIAAAAAAFGGAAAFKILLPGRLTAWKGQTIMIAAAKLLQERLSDTAFKVIMVGSAQGRDEYEADLRAQIEDASLNDIIHIQGHWDDMPAAYHWADVTISASTRPEAFGRVSVEAQAMGCPVIASAHGGSMETIADGTTGFLVNPGDPSALADAIEALIKTAVESRVKIGNAARERIIQQFSVEAMTNATLSVYNSLTVRTGQARSELGH